MKLFDFFAINSGYRDGAHFIDSAFHPDTLVGATAVSASLAGIGYFVKQSMGVEFPVALVIIVLFLLEIFTGVKAAKKEGQNFESKKFGKGWVKLLVYMIMIGCSHMLAIHMTIKPFFGVSLNIYEWLHYGFINFVIIQLIISNIENFKRIGWTEYVPFLDKLYGILNLGKKDEDEESESEEGEQVGADEET
jgi:phage-related holin